MQMPSMRRRWWGLGFMSLGILVVAIDFTVLTIALPTISSSLHASTSQLQWVMDAYTLTGAAAMLPVGVLADRYGRRKLLLAALLVFGGASVWSALSTSVGELILARTIQGVGAGVLLPVPLAVIAAMFDGENRTKAIGISTAAVAGGLPLGPIAGGLLLKYFSWHSVFWVNVPIVAVAFIGCLFTLPESVNPAKPRLDLLGTVFSVGAIVSLVYGVINGPEHGWGNSTTIACLAASIVLFALFLVWERFARQPLVDGKLFKQPCFAWGTAAAIVGTIGLSLVLFLAPLYLQSVNGDSTISTGVRLIPIMVGMFLGGTIAPESNKRLGIKVTVGLGLIALAAGLAIFALATPTSPYWLAVIGFVVVGTGTGAALTVALDSAIASVGGGETGAGAAVTNTLRQVGSSLAYAAGGSILSAIYVSRLDPKLTAFPAAARAAARSSVSGADAVAQQLGAAGSGLQSAAHSAFTDGMSISLYATAGLCAVVALLCLWFLPARLPETVVSVGDEQKSRADVPQ